MPVITFNAFSFLQKKLTDHHLPPYNDHLAIAPGTTARDLIHQMHLSDSDVEVVFINGRVAARDTVLADQDRVALVPHGTPGPYRVLLGFMNQKKH
jgi:sulfur carrier protein ThiS